MAPGGTAPIKTSLAMPPVFAAAKDSTRTPNISKRCFRPATAPLNAKTKVPAKSSRYGSEWRRFSLAKDIERLMPISMSVFHDEIHILGGSDLRLPDDPFAPAREFLKQTRQRRRLCHREPGSCANDQCLDARLQRRMDERRKLWAVVDRQVIDAARLFCLGVSVRVGAAEEPEDGRHVPLRSE